MLALTRLTLTGTVFLAVWAGLAGVAAACGCFNPPVPPPGVTAEQFAVAQQSEQIIFEVEPGFVTAHVLIRYQGKPESFAWLLPVPAEPELSLSEGVTFALLDDVTRPLVAVESENICPVPNYQCTRHPSPRCGFRDDLARGSASDSGISLGADGGARGGTPPLVDVISRQVIGSYDTIVFAAADAMAAVTWLQDEGFIVNDTMTPFMQPYLDAGMLFVASRLIPGAGVEEIRPLRMRYAAEHPMIPLQLTAVAAEPHLTVTAFIYGTTPFSPTDLPITEVDETRISTGQAGRSNYPMVLAQTVDEAGGNAFVVEYDGVAPVTTLGQDACCGGGFDQCGVGGDGQCQCPGSEFDASDCEMIEGLTEGLELLTDLARRHPRMTRLTTRLSPEEMNFDPCFGPGREHALEGRLVLNGHRALLDGCRDDIMDQDLYNAIEGRQDCASVYCGLGGECAVTAAGPGCACGPGAVARAFTDADGLRSVTCVPETPPVDLGAGGLLLPDACASANCGTGSCVDLGGFAACRCNPGDAAVTFETTENPTCRPALAMVGSPGAEDFSAPLSTVPVCAPAPPTFCGEDGWLEETTGGIRGEACESSVPSARLFVVPAYPTCADVGRPSALGGGGGCSAVRAGGAPWALPAGSGLLALALGLVFIRRRN